MKHTILLVDNADVDNSRIMIVDESQKALIEEILDFFDIYDGWKYTFFNDARPVKDFSTLNTSEDKV